MMTSQNSFPAEVIEELGWYVYRLIDPRNGHTFYVGKGRANRVFQHSQNVLGLDGLSEEEEDYINSKNKRIIEILASGMEVQHVIHRHGIESERVAYEVEAALIEAYEGLENIAGGIDNSERGCAHADELLRKYAARVLTPKHQIIAFSCGKGIRERGSAYDACRFAWKLNRARLKDFSIALAVDRGYVVDVFCVKEWLAATPENFPGFPFPIDPKEMEIFSKERTGFIKEERTPEELVRLYKHTRIKNPAQNPVRYFKPDD